LTTFILLLRLLEHIEDIDQDTSKCDSTVTEVQSTIILGTYKYSPYSEKKRVGGKKRNIYLKQ
jgi:hypothetical protein